MVRIHEQFEWDEDKTEANLRKHGVTFEAASEVLADRDGVRFHLDAGDDEHADGEDRYITTGSDPGASSIGPHHLLDGSIDRR